MYELKGTGLSRTGAGQYTKKEMVESLTRLVCPKCQSDLDFKVVDYSTSPSSTSINYYYRCKDKQCELNVGWQEHGMPDLGDL